MSLLEILDKKVNVQIRRHEVCFCIWTSNPPIDEALFSLFPGNYIHTLYTPVAVQKARSMLH